MKIPSSTSQSALRELRGRTTSSFGPQIADRCLLKMIGSSGTGSPDSSAWSV
jgi:hypothetical protein